MPFARPTRHLIHSALPLLSALCFAAAHAGDVPALGAAWTPDRIAAANYDDAAPRDRWLLDGTPLTLALLSDAALRRNPATRVAWASAKVDLAGVDAARALLRPAVSADIALSFSHGDGAGGAVAGTGNAGTPNGVSRSLAPSLGLAWVLFDFGARAAGVEAARWQAAASQLAYNRTLQTVVSQVEQAYFTLLGTRQLQAALQTAVDAAQASLQVAQARRQAGLATVADTAQAEAALADARLKLVQAQTQARNAAGSLANAVGLPVNQPLPLADDATLAPARPGRVDELLASARVSRADLLALNAQVLQGRAQLAAAEAQGRPSVALSGQLSRRWSSDGSERPSQQIGLALSIPIFDGGLVRAQTRAARARVDVLAAQREQQRQSVELDVWQSFQEADSADAVIASAEALLRSAVVAEDAARERYGAGVGLLLELLLAQSTAAQARVSLVQARYDAKIAISRLAYAVGAAIGTSPPHER